MSGPPFVELENYGRELGLPANTLSRYFRGDPEFSEVEIGAMEIKEFFQRLPKRILHDAGVAIDLERIRAALVAVRPLLPDMMDLAAALSEHHIVAVMTNNVADNQQWYADNLPSSVFAFIMNSAIIGVRKPDEAIYLELVRRLGCPAADIVFIDDFAENLVPAAKLGMKTVLFTDIGDCKTQLSAHGAQFGRAGTPR